MGIRITWAICRASCRFTWMPGWMDFLPTMRTMASKRGMPSYEPEDRADCAGGAGHRVFDREGDYNTGPVSAVAECSGECLQPEEQPGSGHGAERGHGATDDGWAFEE